MKRGIYQIMYPVGSTNVLAKLSEFSKPGLMNTYFLLKIVNTVQNVHILQRMVYP